MYFSTLPSLVSACEPTINIQWKQHDYLGWCLENRDEVLSAALAVLRLDPARIEKSSRFPNWDRQVRARVIAAGYEDPYSIDTFWEDDITYDMKAETLELCMEDMKKQPFGIKKLADHLKANLDKHHTQQTIEFVLHKIDRKTGDLVPFIKPIRAEAFDTALMGRNLKKLQYDTIAGMQLRVIDNGSKPNTYEVKIVNQNEYDSWGNRVEK